LVLKPAQIALPVAAAITFHCRGCAVYRPGATIALRLKPQPMAFVWPSDRFSLYDDYWVNIARRLDVVVSSRLGVIDGARAL
jgi:hypothetical protein